MISVLLEKITQDELNFEQLEKTVWKHSLDLFQHLMVEVLEEFDQMLMETRDKERYGNKEKNPRTIETLVGGIEFKRRYYWDSEKHEWVYLLDEALELEPKKTIGPGLLQLAVTWATKGPSYRDARDRLIDLFEAQLLSHETIRQALLEVGASCKRQSQNKIVREEGQKEVNALFIEVDGFGARMQKNRKRKRDNRRHEAKMAVIHEGWAPRHNGEKTDYKLVNPIYISDLKPAEDFWEQTRGIIHANYLNVDDILVVINGDGAEWIRQGATFFAKGMYQYNRFHIARELRTGLQSNTKALRKAQKALKENNVGNLLYVVTEAWVTCTDEEEKEKLEKLKDIIFKNYEHIADYRVRLKRKGFKVCDKWRSLGAAESNVNKFKNRTAKRGRAWSPEGLEAILATLTHLFDGTLQKNITRSLDDIELWPLDKVTAGAGRVTPKMQSNSIGVKRAGLPATRHGTKGFSKLFNRLNSVAIL